MSLLSCNYFLNLISLVNFLKLIFMVHEFLILRPIMNEMRKDTD